MNLKKIKEEMQLCDVRNILLEVGIFGEFKSITQERLSIGGGGGLKA